MKISEQTVSSEGAVMSVAYDILGPWITIQIYDPEFRELFPCIPYVTHPLYGKRITVAAPEPHPKPRADTIPQVVAVPAIICAIIDKGICFNLNATLKTSDFNALLPNGDIGKTVVVTVPKPSRPKPIPAKNHPGPQTSPLL